MVLSVGAAHSPAHRRAVRWCSLIGAPAKRIEVRGIEGKGLEADRAELHREIVRGNGERIIADPSVALDAITQQC